MQDWAILAAPRSKRLLPMCTLEINLGCNQALVQAGSKTHDKHHPRMYPNTQQASSRSWLQVQCLAASAQLPLQAKPSYISNSWLICSGTLQPILFELRPCCKRHAPLQHPQQPCVTPKHIFQNLPSMQRAALWALAKQHPLQATPCDAPYSRRPFSCRSKSTLGKSLNI